MSTFEVLRYDEVRLNYVTINTEGIFLRLAQSDSGSEFRNSHKICLFVSAVFSSIVNMYQVKTLGTRAEKNYYHL